MLRAFHHLELQVGNARQAAHFWGTVLGFRVAGYRGPETGERRRASWLMEQGDARIVLTAALRADDPSADFVARHGEGVAGVAFVVEEAAAAWRGALDAGARPVADPSAGQATVGVYGDTVHTLLERPWSRLPAGFVAARAPWPEADCGLRAIDHVVANAEAGRMMAWADFYARAFGLRRLITFDERDISAEFTALRSVVMAGGSVKLPINEPAPGRRRSQIEEYLESYQGPGVQHVALATDDLLATVGELRRRGLVLLHVPDAYYDALPARLGDPGRPIEQLRAARVLVDRDEHGLLYQIFGEPLGDRPTLFLEFIERRGARSFGKGNFQAVFEAIEREQAKRGRL